jgi:ATP-dependent RNA helicase SUPV3L1/SUV3
MLRKYGVRWRCHIISGAAQAGAAGAGDAALGARCVPRPRGLGGRAACRSGRTSIAADWDVAKVLYRTAGYRACGERAVRVDIWNGWPI